MNVCILKRWGTSILKRSLKYLKTHNQIVKNRKKRQEILTMVLSDSRPDPGHFPIILSWHLLWTAIWQPEIKDGIQKFYDGPCKISQTSATPYNCSSNAIFNSYCKNIRRHLDSFHVVLMHTPMCMHIYKLLILVGLIYKYNLYLWGMPRRHK